jgi:hypothetical protein
MAEEILAPLLAVSISPRYLFCHLQSAGQLLCPMTAVGGEAVGQRLHEAPRENSTQIDHLPPYWPQFSPEKATDCISSCLPFADIFNDPRTPLKNGGCSSGLIGPAFGAIYEQRLAEQDRHRPAEISWRSLEERRTVSKKLYSGKHYISCPMYFV